MRISDWSSDVCSSDLVAAWLSNALGRTVPLVSNWIDGVELEPGQIALGENTRFLLGEKTDDEALAKKMAALCDFYVMDAFGTAHHAGETGSGSCRERVVITCRSRWSL